MNKAAIVTASVVAVLAAGALAAPAYIGMTVTKRLNSYGDELVQVLPSAKVTAKTHHGLFRSSREVTIQLGCLPAIPDLPAIGGAPSVAASEPQPITVTVSDDIRHGPFLGKAGFGAAAIDSKLVLPEAWKPMAKRLFGDQPPLLVHTIARFDGRIESTVQVAGVHVSEPGLGGLDLVPIAVTLRTEPAAGGATRFVMDAGDVELRAGPAGEPVTVKALGLKTETTLAAAKGAAANAPIWLRPGRNKTQLSSLTVRGLAPSSDGSPPKPFELGVEDVTASSETKLDNGLMSMESQLAMKGRFNEVKLDKLEGKVAMRRIHAASYQKLMTGQLGTLFSCDPSVQQQAMAGLEDEQKELFAELLVHDPEYALDQLAVEIGGQRAQLSYSVGTKGMTKADFANPFPALLTKIVAKVAAEIQLGLIERMVKAASEAVAAAGGPAGAAGALPPGVVPPGAAAGLPGLSLPPGLEGGDPAMAMALVNAMIGHAVEEGYVVREGDKVRFSAELANGKATLNGKPFDLPDLGALPAAMPGALPIGGP